MTVTDRATNEKKTDKNDNLKTISNFEFYE